jgi:cell division septation protein DedD
VPESAPEPAQAPEQAADQLAGQVASESQPAQAEAPPPPQLSEPPAGAYVMQLASVRSEETARSEWARMQSEHDLLLGDMPLFIQQVELEGRGTYFRIQTGPFPSRSTAQDLCAQLKTAGQDCLVTQR